MSQFSQIYGIATALVMCATACSSPFAFHKHESLRPVSSSAIVSPRGIALDSSGNVFFASEGHNQAFELKASGELDVVAGNGDLGFAGNNGPATQAQLAHPMAVAVDRADNVFVADTGNNRIMRVDAISGVITTVVGNGSISGSSGLLAVQVSLWRPVAVAVDANGHLFLAESTFEEIRQVDIGTGTISAVAGFATAGFGEEGYPANRGPSLAGPLGLAIGKDGNLLIADTRNHRVCRVDVRTGIMTVIAGNAIGGFSDDGQYASGATLLFPEGVASDKAGDIFIADTGNNRIRKVDITTGFITTVAGNGRAGFVGDGSAAVHASLSGPTAVAVDQTGNIFIADTGNNRIRKVSSATGTITTVAGNLGVHNTAPVRNM